MRTVERARKAPLEPGAAKPATPAGESVALAMRYLFRAMMAIADWPMRVSIFGSLLLTIGAKLAAVGAPFVLAKALNTWTPDPQHMVAAALTGIGIWTALRLLGNVAPNIREGLFAPVSAAVQRYLGRKAFAHAHALSVDFHQNRRLGAMHRVIERGVRGADFLLRFLTFTIAPTVFELVLAAAALALVYGPMFAFVALATIGIYAWSTFAITDWRIRYRREMNETDQEANARAIDSLMNVETVKAFAAEERESARYDEALKSYAKASVRAATSLAFLNGAQNAVMALGLGAMAWLAVSRISSGDAGALGPGDVTAVILVMLNLYAPLNILGFAYAEIKQSAADMEQLFVLLDQQPSVADVPGAVPLVVTHGAVDFEDVVFRHGERAQGLEGLSFKIKPGSFVGLVGPSGAGKSTALRLLFRFFDPQSGRVLIDGQNIAKVQQRSLRGSLGLVPQDVVLFNDTLLFNLTYGRPEATDEEVALAVAQAHLTDFVARLPDGLQTRVGERGVKLSGGERQRVGLARVLLCDPKILVLDEATSALDSHTEAEVQKALMAAARGRTTLAVAHRLSTVMEADEILVLDEGKVAERGTHDELVARGGLYAQLWHRQSREHTPDAVAAQTTA